jgi:lysozyme
MKTSQRGLDFIAEHEGTVLAAYPDPATGGEPWTIGVGRAHGVSPGDTCTEAQALQWLAEDVQEAEDAINRLVTVQLTQDMFDALVSFIFNLGAGNFAGSTLLKRINAGDFENASKEFPKWNRAAGRVMAGLTKRRLAESALFQSEFA